MSDDRTFLIYATQNFLHCHCFNIFYCHILSFEYRLPSLCSPRNWFMFRLVNILKALLSSASDCKLFWDMAFGVVVKTKGESEWTLTPWRVVQKDIRDMGKQRGFYGHRIEESSSRQAGNPQNKPVLSISWTWTLSPQNSEKISACLVCLVCSISLWSS